MPDDTPNMASILQGMPTRQDWDNFAGPQMLAAAKAPFEAWSRLYDQAMGPGLGSVTEGTMSPQTLGDALTVGGAMAGTGYGIPKPENSLGIFGGRLAKTAWRFEIPDRNARFDYESLPELRGVQ
jgi:hypothetical protein